MPAVVPFSESKRLDLAGVWVETNFRVAAGDGMPSVGASRS